MFLSVAMCYPFFYIDLLEEKDSILFRLQCGFCILILRNCNAASTEVPETNQVVCIRQLAGRINRNATTHHYHWNVTSGARAPDGFNKTVYLTNDPTPGPTIEARSGDTLVVEVVNSLSNDEGLSIHWHGMHMTDANEVDGGVGFTQCAIPPGCNFTYEFQIDDDQAGTFWYHSHSQEQTGDGLYGGLIVHQPADVTQPKSEDDYDDVVLLMIGDWGHKTVAERMKQYLSHVSDGREPVPDTLLINGPGTFDCSEAARKYGIHCPVLEPTPQPQLWVDRHKRYRFRIVNVGSLTGITVAMPGSEMKVIGVDGGSRIGDSAITDSLGILYPGERVDVVAEWTNCPDDFNSSLTVALDRENFARSGVTSMVYSRTTSNEGKRRDSFVDLERAGLSLCGQSGVQVFKGWGQV
jgi:FtsP/CotA-like multicopper oxidase with cupredoxin domain